MSLHTCSIYEVYNVWTLVLFVGKLYTNMCTKRTDIKFLLVDSY